VPFRSHNGGESTSGAFQKPLMLKGFVGRDAEILTRRHQLDQLVGARLRQSIDPTADIESYLQSQKGGPNPEYKRPGV
jgi:hypothetical protein